MWAVFIVKANIIKELIEDGAISISSCKYSKIDSGYTLIIHNFS